MVTVGGLWIEVADPPRDARTPAFFHEEALDVLPALLAQLDATKPILVGHSDGGSIALIHAGGHEVSGLVLIAPHVVVEDITVDAIRRTRDEFDNGELRARMARHHDDPDAAFGGWCDVWLDPSFRDWSIEDEAARVTAPTLLIQGAEDPYGTLDQLDRIEARVRGQVERLVVPGGHSPHLDRPEQVVQAIADFVAQLLGKLVVRRVGATALDERRDPARVVEHHADDPCGADLGMVDEHVLHVDRGDPQPADLEHLVGAPDVDVGAVLAALVAVAGGEPVAAHARLRLLVLVPVEGGARVAADLEVADRRPVEHAPLLVGDAQLVSRHGEAGRTALHCARPVRA